MWKRNNAEKRIEFSQIHRENITDNLLKEIARNNTNLDSKTQVLAI